MLLIQSKMRILISFLFIYNVLCSCNSNSTYDFTIERKYVSHVYKLTSPDKSKALYSYYVKYPGAHYGQTRFIILPNTEKFSSSGNFFAFSDILYGFNIEGWSGDTIKSICITASQSPPQELLPFKTQLTKVLNGLWVQDYYYANAFGIDDIKYFDSIIYSKEIVSFVGKDTTVGIRGRFRIAAKKGQVIVPIGDSIIQVNRLEDLTTLDGKYNLGDTIKRSPLVSLNGYILRPKREIDWKKLKDFGVFVEQTNKE
jgi:hypothetical protein